MILTDLDGNNSVPAVDPIPLNILTVRRYSDIRLWPTGPHRNPGRLRWNQNANMELQRPHRDLHGRERQPVAADFRHSRTTQEGAGTERCPSDGVHGNGLRLQRIGRSDFGISIGWTGVDILPMTVSRNSYRPPIRRPARLATPTMRTEMWSGKPALGVCRSVIPTTP